MSDLNSKSNNKAKAIVSFLVHQLVGTIGVMVLTGLLTSLIINIFRLFGGASSEHDLARILTETPYFPAQITIAFILGWVLSRRFRHQGMLWIWVIPTAFLAYLVIALPTTAAALASNARLSHFFGHGCRVESHCFDQLGATLPFYVSIAYSVGALIERRKWRRSSASERGPVVRQTARHV